MKSKTTLKFRKAFAALPKQVQDQARKSYRQFKQDPWHQSLKHLNGLKDMKKRNEKDTYFGNQR